MSGTPYSQPNIIRCLRQAEGYLELATLFDDINGLSGDQQTVLADCCLALLDRIQRPGRRLGHIRYLRGQAHRLACRYRQAVAELQESWQFEPGNIHTCLALGWCFKRLGNLAQAVMALQQAIALEPANGLLHFNLACYLTLEGQHGLALIHLARAIELDAGYRELANREPDFDAIRHEPAFQELAAVTA